MFADTKLYVVYERAGQEPLTVEVGNEEKEGKHSLKLAYPRPPMPLTDGETVVVRLKTGHGTYSKPKSFVYRTPTVPGTPVI